MKVGYQKNKDELLQGIDGLPVGYPVPSEENDVAFYIQRNQNQNTVIYQFNINPDGYINQEQPLNVYWKRYEDGGMISFINQLQKTLAYGYDHKVINNDTIQLSIVSYPSYKMYLTRVDGRYVVQSLFDSEWQTLKNIYVYADGWGAFPDVKYVELYGEETCSYLPCFHKINISE